MGDNVRTGMMATLQFKPNDVYSSTIDMYYTTREQENNARSLEVNFGNSPIGPCCGDPAPPGAVVGFTNPVIVDNTVIGGNLTSRVPLARNFLFETEDSITPAGWYMEGRAKAAEAVSQERQNVITQKEAHMVQLQRAGFGKTGKDRVTHKA